MLRPYRAPLIIIVATHTTSQVRQRGFYILRALALFESIHHFVELGWKFLPHFLSHFAHHLSHGTRVIFETLKVRAIPR